MKKLWKLLSLALIVALLAGVVAMAMTGCGAETAAEEEEEFQLEVEGFQVGFSRVEMNPEVNAPLDGMGAMKFRYIQKMTDGGMTCSAVALSDGHGTHYMWITSDLMASDTMVNSTVRKGISQKTGIPEENFIIAVSHSHSAPTTSGSYAGGEEYRRLVVQRHIEAGVNAMKDRKPAKLYVGEVETEGLIFIRHYKNTTMDGEVHYFGDNFGVAVYDDTTDHVDEVDPTMYLLRFEREGDKDVVVVNYQAHPHFTDGVDKYELSADYIVAFRDALEHYTGDHVVYFQGAAGDVNSKSRLTYEQRTDDMRTWGTFLAQHAMEGLENNMREVEDPKIEFKHMILEAEINHTMDHLYAQAKAVTAIFQETGKRESANHLLTQDGTGIRSVYHASAVIANYSRTTATDGMLPLKAFAFSEDVALLTYCGELFQEHKLAMEEYSPFETTMLFGYSDYRAAYLPSYAAFEYTCYETDMFRFTFDTPDRVREVYMELLDDVYSKYE